MRYQFLPTKGYPPLFFLLMSSRSTMRQFSHEKLNVSQTAITFVVWSSDLLPDIPKSMAVHSQLIRASSSNRDV